MAGRSGTGAGRLGRAFVYLRFGIGYFRHQTRVSGEQNCINLDAELVSGDAYQKTPLLTKEGGELRRRG